MTDQCRHCTLKGDWKSCKSEDCGHHDNCGWKQLEKENQALRAQVQDLKNLLHDTCSELHEKSGYVRAFSDSDMPEEYFTEVGGVPHKIAVAEIEAAAVEKMLDTLEPYTDTYKAAEEWAANRRKEAQK